MHRIKEASRVKATMRDDALREHLLYLLSRGGAHLDFESAIAEMPAELLGAKLLGVPHAPWRLVEHMRIAQWDILEYCTCLGNPRMIGSIVTDRVTTPPLSMGLGMTVYWVGRYCGGV